MFWENLKTNKQKIHLYSKKVLKSFISSRYLKLKINILFWEGFCKMHCLICTYLCAHTLPSHLCFSIVADLCFWSHVWPLQSWHWLKFIKCLWWLELSESKMHSWASPSGEKKSTSQNPFQIQGFLSCQKLTWETNQKEKVKNHALNNFFFFWRTECSFVGVYKLPVTWKTPCGRSLDCI